MFPDPIVMYDYLIPDASLRALCFDSDFVDLFNLMCHAGPLPSGSKCLIFCRDGQSGAGKTLGCHRELEDSFRRYIAPSTHIGTIALFTLHITAMGSLTPL